MPMHGGAPVGNTHRRRIYPRVALKVVAVAGSMGAVVASQMEDKSKRGRPRGNGDSRIRGRYLKRRMVRRQLYLIEVSLASTPGDALWGSPTGAKTVTLHPTVNQCSV